MVTNVIIDATREGYSTEQVRNTMTVKELIDVLSEYDEDAKVYLSHDNGYTYGASVMAAFQNRKPKNNSKTQLI